MLYRRNTGFQCVLVAENGIWLIWLFFIISTLLTSPVALGVDLKTQNLCNDIINEDDPLYKVVISEAPEIKVDRSNYFSLNVLDYLIPVPNIKFDNVIVRQVDNSIRFVVLRSKSDDLSIWLSFLSISSEPISGALSYQDVIEIMYQNKPSDIDCKAISKDDRKLILELFTRGILDDDVCNLDAVHEIDGGWLLKGDKQSCTRPRGFDWKFRSEIKHDSMFEVKWKLGPNEKYQNIGYALNSGGNDFYQTPQEFVELSYCIEANDVQCLLDIKDIEVTLFEPARLKKQVFPLTE